MITASFAVEFPVIGINQPVNEQAARAGNRLYDRTFLAYVARITGKGNA